MYRMMFAPTVFSSRQLVSHGHILVNGQKVTVPSYAIKDGDVISVKEKSRELPVVIQGLTSQEREVPEYMEVDPKKVEGKFVRGPQLADVPYPVTMEPNLVVEFYSR